MRRRDESFVLVRLMRPSQSAQVGLPTEPLECLRDGWVCTKTVLIDLRIFNGSAAFSRGSEKDSDVLYRRGS